MFQNVASARESGFTTQMAWSAPDLDGGGPEAQAWWEAPCEDRI